MTEALHLGRDQNISFPPPHSLKYFRGPCSLGTNVSSLRYLLYFEFNPSWCLQFECYVSCVKSCHFQTQMLRETPISMKWCYKRFVLRLSNLCLSLSSGYYQPAGPLIKESSGETERALARYHPAPHYHAPHPPVRLICKITPL